MHYVICNNEIGRCMRSIDIIVLGDTISAKVCCNCYDIVTELRNKQTKSDNMDTCDTRIKEINCCAECEFVGKESYHGSHVWCRHPRAWGINLPNRDMEIHPDCPIETFKTVMHIHGEYAKNVTEYIPTTP